MSRPVRALWFHAEYRCRHAGACCTSGWPIPVEADRLAGLQTALATGRLRPAHRQSLPPLLHPAAAPAETPALLGISGRECVFHDPAAGCRIHGTLGHDALPLACRQFPRVCVMDPRGVSVTLSHYCPTAAGLLTADEPAASLPSAITVDPPGFPSAGEYVGLDARDALPPLLRAGMLMDWPVWWEIERLAVESLLGRGASAAAALALVRGAVRDIAAWTPREEPLDTRVAQAFAAAMPVHGEPRAALVAAAMATVPPEYRSAAAWDSATATQDLVARRFLASHAFASWTIHTGGDLHAWQRSLDVADALLGAGAGVRHADLVLRHLADATRRPGPS